MKLQPRAVTREQIVLAAREWIDTPFVHQHRVRGVGVDCVGLLVGVARDLGFIAPTDDITGYSRNPDGSMLRLLDEHLERVREPRPANVIAMRFRDGQPQHLGIVYAHRYGCLGMIHASDPRGRVVESRLMFGQHMRFVGAWAFPGVVG